MRRGIGGEVVLEEVNWGRSLCNIKNKGNALYLDKKPQKNRPIGAVIFLSSQLSLACFEAGVGFVYYVNATLAADNATVFIARF